MAQPVYSIEALQLVLLRMATPHLFIRAEGKVRTSGWTNPMLVPRTYVTPPADGIWDVDFVADPPTGIVLFFLDTKTAELTIELSGEYEGIKGIRVHSETGQVQKLLGVAVSHEPIDTQKVDVKEYYSRILSEGGSGGRPYPW